MKIVYNNYLPSKRFAAINLFGIVFARSEKKPLSAKIQRHEGIHTRQMIELLFVFFYLWYGIEWLVRFIQYRNAHTAYRNISFEREAYDNELDIDYLKNRKFYAFIRYLKKV